MGGQSLNFYTPEVDSPFAAADDDPPTFSVGVAVPKAYGAHLHGTNIHMSVWSEETSETSSCGRIIPSPEAPTPSSCSRPSWRTSARGPLTSRRANTNDRHYHRRQRWPARAPMQESPSAPGARKQSIWADRPRVIAVSGATAPKAVTVSEPGGGAGSGTVHARAPCWPA
jgi:hypothetical protein